MDSRKKRHNSDRHLFQVLISGTFLVHTKMRRDTSYSTVALLIFFSTNKTQMLFLLL